MTCICLVDKKAKVILSLKIYQFGGTALLVILEIMNICYGEDH